jgi:hypothetical protein
MAFSLGVAGTMVVLAALALLLSQTLAATAAGLCAVAFFIPGVFFLNQTRRLFLRDLALTHAAQLAESKGVTDADAMAKELAVPREDAEKILRKAIVEGHVQGEIDAAGRFVSAATPRCPRCHMPLAKDETMRTCPRCGAALAQGG